MHSEFTVDAAKLALNLIRQAVNFDHVLGQELLKEKKRDGDWSSPPVLPTTLFFFCTGQGLEGERKTSLRNNSLTLPCSFLGPTEIGGFLELVGHFLALRLHAVTSTFDTWVPCAAWQRLFTNTHPGIPDSYVTAGEYGLCVSVGAGGIKQFYS